MIIYDNGDSSCFSTSKQNLTQTQHSVKELLKTIEIQRWDDHRFYHQSRINQSLHFISALTFIVAYALALKDPATAALLAWGVSMTTRQSGHFFFEPQGYDHVNDATHEHKEAIKVGYNLKRKVVLMSLWVIIPVVLWLSPSLAGAIQPAEDWKGFLMHVGYAWFWLGVGGVAFRTVHLFFIHNVQDGVAWALKILTDPFHDALLYWRAPFYLMGGQLIDPMEHVRETLTGHEEHHDDVSEDAVEQPGTV
jgi:hypothetical protein